MRGDVPFGRGELRDPTEWRLTDPAGEPAPFAAWTVWYSECSRAFPQYASSSHRSPLNTGGLGGKAGAAVQK